MLFSLDEIKIIHVTMEFSKVLLSTNQNRALIIRKFLSFLISTNQSRASIVMDFSTNLLSINQN